MKIYTKVKINIDTGKVVEEDSFEYYWPVAECKGGGSHVNTQDKEYNARMATIAEAQQVMAQDYYGWYKTNYQPMETAQVAANMEMMPQETAFQKSQAELGAAKNQAEIGLLPQETALQQGKMQTAIGLLPQQAQAASQFYDAAMNGADPTQRANQAQADVASAFNGTMQQANRSLARMGVAPDSGAQAAATQRNALAKAKAIGVARTGARTTAEQENFKRLQAAFGGI